MFWRRKDSRAVQGVLWLVKDDPKGEWHCACPQGIVDAPYHDRDMSPVGGTGWLFTCTRCRRAFMFAKARRITQSLEQIAETRTPRIRQIYDVATNTERRQVLLAEPRDWLEAIRPLREGLVEGQRYVFFDGCVLPAVAGPVRFRGLWREHDLRMLPHIAGGGTGDLLTSSEYWHGGEAEQPG